MINEIYQDSENDNMVPDIEREIPELVVRSNDCSPACLTPPLSRSSSTVRGSGKHLEFNSEGGLCENDDDVDFSPPIIPSLLSSAADLLVTNNSGDREQCPTSTERSYSDADPHPQSEHSPRSSLQYSACVNDPLLAPKIPSFLCPECGKSFEKNFLLNTHLDATHPDSVHLICTVMYCIVQVSTTLFVLNL